jgi:DNA-binding NarL/FixJ family response regulator
VGLVIAKPGPVREGLQAVLSAIPNMEAAESACFGPTILDQLKSLEPDLVIMGPSLSVDEASVIVWESKKQWPGTCCIAIVNSPREQYVLEAAGADAVLIEGSPAALLSAAIKALLAQATPEKE